MQKDFTLDIYRKLIESLLKNEYSLIPVHKFFSKTTIGDKLFILRNDVDKKPENSLKIAQLLYSYKISATFYFRIVEESFNPKIIEKISSLGHEIGYHYEDLTLAKGNFEHAIESFEKNLAILRNHAEIKTICMHGSPLSQWDNRRIWERCDYKTYDIIAEPYFDFDFNKIFYLTDTGRKWNDTKSSIRDKVNSIKNIKMDSTQDIIKLISSAKFPEKVLQNIHPQRWTNNLFEWGLELAAQKMKNIIKQNIIKKRMA